MHGWFTWWQYDFTSDSLLLSAYQPKDCEWVCKPGSVTKTRSSSIADGHLSVHDNCSSPHSRPTRTVDTRRTALCSAQTSRRMSPRNLRSVWSSFGWGLPSRSSHPDRWCALTAPFQPCHAFAPTTSGPREPFGGLLSVALSLASRPVDVIDHPVL